jgi:hypothetical protein
MMYKTHYRGFIFFLECTGILFEGRCPIPCKMALTPGEQAIKSLASGKRSWVREVLPS